MVSPSHNAWMTLKVGTIFVSEEDPTPGVLRKGIIPWELVVAAAQEYHSIALSVAASDTPIAYLVQDEWVRRHRAEAVVFETALREVL
jgi:hypothetical protein